MCPCSGPFASLIRMRTVVNICVNLPPCGASVYTGVLQWLGMLCRDVWRYLQHCGKINRIIQRLNNFYCCTKKKPYVSQCLMCVHVFFTAGMLFFSCGHLVEAMMCIYLKTYIDRTCILFIACMYKCEADKTRAWLRLLSLQAVMEQVRMESYLPP